MRTRLPGWMCGAGEDFHLHPVVGPAGSRDGGYSDSESEERGVAVPVVDREGFVDVEPLLLEDEVGEEVSEFGGEDSDSGSDHDVAHPVAVIELPGDSGSGGDGISADAVPGLRCPYSLCSMVAVMKAVAVCPEGKEFRAEPSGRFTRQVYLSELTAMAIKPCGECVRDEHPAQELRLWTPQAFSASIAPAGGVLGASRRTPDGRIVRIRCEGGGNRSRRPA